MQPYFAPYLGYFQLINYVDKWVVFDDVQYIYHGWINRNRILHPTKDWQYITIPLNKHKRSEMIKNIEINNNIEWKRKILGQLSIYKKRAPYYEEVIKIVEKCFNYKSLNLVDFNVNVLKELCNYLGIKFDFIISSQYNFNYEEVNTSGDWALEISKQLNATEYINPFGGMELFDEKKFIENNIQLKFLKMADIKYNQRNKEFQSGLSIIDIIMFNSKLEVLSMLDGFEVF